MPVAVLIEVSRYCWDTDPRAVVYNHLPPCIVLLGSGIGSLYVFSTWSQIADVLNVMHPGTCVALRGPSMETDQSQR